MMKKGLKMIDPLLNTVLPILGCIALIRILEPKLAEMFFGGQPRPTLLPPQMMASGGGGPRTDCCVKSPCAKPPETKAQVDSENY